MKKVIYEPIGIIHTPFKGIKDMPIQAKGGRGIKGTIKMNPALVQGLEHCDKAVELEVKVKTNHEKELEEIRTKYGIEPDDFWKLRRRAIEFFRIAFASHLGIVFQPLREEADEKICGPTSD